MGRLRIVSKKVHTRPSSSVPRNSNSWLKEKGWHAMEFTVEDTKSGRRVVIEPIPFTDEGVAHRRHMEREALKMAAKRLA